MRPVKVIPTNPATKAALEAKAPDAPSPLPEGTPDSTFSKWLIANHIGTLSMTVDQAAAALADAPITDSPMGQAWVAAIRSTIERANTDEWRKFDVATVEDTDEALTTELDELRERLEATSPLLVPAAEALAAFTPDTGMTLTRVRQLLAGVTGDTLPVDLPRDNDDAETADMREQLETETDPERRTYLEDHIRISRSYASFDAPIPWEHVHLLAPGTQDTVTRIVTALYGNLPTGAPGVGARLG